MNVTEFAEQIVFGQSLEDKLLRPGRLTSGSKTNRFSVDALDSPARPNGLEMRHAPVDNVQAPSDQQLENERARGKLLHYLANHELLATELMALVLLKFPDAPHAFRRGVLVTLQEEQEHTRMYLQRMKECGVEFGEYPLSGHFWRIVEPMKSPMDFVSRLSLTFEQANLDYSLHFSHVFRKLGDDATANLLQKIYEDEISHVQHGLEWFRQWKDPEQSDWEAFRASLEFPMSPQRARGPRGSFNRHGREQAGLTTEFINALEMFRQSRGRMPDVHWFDPAVEAELAGEAGAYGAATSETGSLMLEQLALDLELVMVPITKQDDVMLVRQIPSAKWQKRMTQRGIDLPQFIPMESREELRERKLSTLCPWAWTPKNHAIANPLLRATKNQPKSWNNDFHNLFRKSWTILVQSRWQAKTKPSWFADESALGIPIRDLSELEKGLAEIQKRGFNSAIFKPDLGASGRGQRRFSCEESLTTKDADWLEAALKNRTSNDLQWAIVEPELNRVVDLSFLWHLPASSNSSSDVNFLGWTQPIVSPGRRYSGTQVGNRFPSCSPELKRFLLADRTAKIRETADWIQAHLVPELLAVGFSGHFGVDAFVFVQGDDQFKIKPIVELNPRLTMGNIALNLQKRVAPGIDAEFRIFSVAQWKKIEQQMNKVEYEVSPNGRWRSGAIVLSDSPAAASKLVPAVIVGGPAIRKMQERLATPSS